MTHQQRHYGDLLKGNQPDPLRYEDETAVEHIKNALQLLQMEQELHNDESELAGAIYARLEKALFAMGQNPPSRYSPASRRLISAEVSHLIRDKGYAPERALAAAHDIARRKGLKVPPRPNPMLAIVNPAGETYQPRSLVGRRVMGGRLMGTAVYQIKYRHAQDGKDYVHDFERPDDVRLRVLDDRTVCMLSSGRLIGMR